MRIRYLIADDADQLLLVPNDQIESLWRDEVPCWNLQLNIGRELRLITVVLDENLLPKICFFARLDLWSGRIEPSSRDRVCRLLGRRMHYTETPEMRRHFSGWPRDWLHQLAIALDVPVSRISRLGLGGPLLMSTVWGVSLHKVLEYFETIDD